MQQVSVLETNIGSSTTGNSANTQIIFNDAGTLRGDAQFTWNKTLNRLTVDGDETITGDLTINNDATITGDLTVRTNKLAVTSTGVGCGTASPTEPLHVNKSSGTGTFIRLQDSANTNYIGTDNGNFRLLNGTSPVYDLLNIQQLGVFTFGDGAGGTRMTLNSTGLCVGVVPSAWNAGYKAIELGSNVGSFSATTGIFDSALNAFFNTSSQWIYKTTAAASIYRQQAGEHRWFNAPSGTAGNAITFTQAMTLTSGGDLLVGQTTAALDASGGFYFRNAAASGGSSLIVNHRSAVTSGNSYAEFTYNGVGIGSITQNGTTGVLYNINSDYRLKESIAPLSGGLARINALKPSIYKWKSDGCAGEGFIAHELAEVVPFAVSGEKDAVNADGSIKSQGIDMSRIVPILVAAIQELTAEVNALKNA